MTDAQVEQILALLTEIRDALYWTEPEPDPDICLHPEDQRISLATPGQPFHWICNRCKYECVGVTTN